MKLLQALLMQSLLTIAVCVLLGAGADALAGAPARQDTSGDKGKAKPPVASEQPKAKANAPAADAAKVKTEKPARAAEPVKLKVFRLKHDDPQSVGLTLQLLLSAPSGKNTGAVGGLGGLGGLLLGGAPQGAFLGGIGGLSGMGGVGGGIGGVAGIGGIGGGIGGFNGIGGIPGAQQGGLGALGAGGLGFAGGQALGMAGGPAPSAVQGAIAGATRLVADTPSGALLARGPERDLKVVADVVTVLNTAPGKRLPKVKNVHAFQLKHANPEDVATAVELLGIEARIAPLRMPGGDTAPDEQRRFLFALGTEEQMREIGEVIQGMDVEPKEGVAGV
jgi:Bacterial type II/III secretion system short domain